MGPRDDVESVLEGFVPVVLLRVGLEVHKVRVALGLGFGECGVQRFVGTKTVDGDVDWGC